MPNHYPSLNADKALIWRIVHRDNLPWLLAHGLHCRNAAEQDPRYLNIGSAELIDKRAHRAVPIAPGGHAQRLCAVLLHAVLGDDEEHPLGPRGGAAAP